MNACVFYFSRTGNTKRLAEAIAELIKAPIFSMTTADPSVASNYDLLFIGTPTEGSRPAKEASEFVKQLPKAQAKSTILFNTCRFWAGGTLKAMEKELSEKGYKNLLSVTKKGMKPDKPEDFSEVLEKIKKAIA